MKTYQQIEAEYQEAMGTARKAYGAITDPAFYAYEAVVAPIREAHKVAFEAIEIPASNAFDVVHKPAWKAFMEVADKARDKRGMKRILLIAFLATSCKPNQSPVSPVTQTVLVAPTATPMPVGVTFSEFVELPGYPYEARAQAVFSFAGPVTMDHYAYTNFGWYNNTGACSLTAGEPVTVAITLYRGSSVSRVGYDCFAQVNNLYDSNQNVIYVEGKIKSGGALSTACLWQ